MQQVIGFETTYTGTEHPYLVGYRVKVIGVIKGATGTLITDDATLAASGGLTADDRVEVMPWLARERDWSFCSSDPRATDLAAFAGVGAGRRAPRM